MPQPKIIAFHLPQFHPIEENDQWWGAGFTEWRNVAAARPLFPGHKQPNLPGELGFYDLRLDETRERQAELADWAGVSAFCYYHYWFAGKLLLQQPVELLLKRGSPSLPFCFCWANGPWTADWVGQPDRVFIDQTYPGQEDDRRHYEYLRPFFEDERYLRLGGKPVFSIFVPRSIPHLPALVERLRSWAVRDGVGELHLIALDDDPELRRIGFDALAPHTLRTACNGYLRGSRRLVQLARHRLLRYPRWVIEYAKFIRHFPNASYDGITTYPTVIPNWDNTARHARRGFALVNGTPELFGRHLRDSVRGMEPAAPGVERLLFIKSWNEWAEGNHLEPDLRWGRGWLKAVRDFVAEMRLSPLSVPEILGR